MGHATTRHCAELNRCNQRGGRMLSVTDLLDAGSLDLDLAAYLMSRISRGASFMVGARPGGAGKTTVMCALLNLVAPGVELVAAQSSAVRDAERQGIGTRRCYICHEIGSGPYFAYLWSGDLRAYCSLTQNGHQLATNLHADDLHEARSQVCEDNGVPERHFNAFELALFLRVARGSRGTTRAIDTVYASDGASPHSLVYSASRGLAAEEGSDGPWQGECRRFLRTLHNSAARTIEETREGVVDFLGAHGEAS
jgi:hypothetical protein